MSQSEYIQCYEQFRQETENKHLRVGGNQWQYFTTGEGSEAVLILHGGGSVAEATFRYIRKISDHFKVIAPTFPVGVSTAKEAVYSLRELLEKEGVNEVHLLGFSEGGMIAQCFVRAYPGLTRSVILFVSMGPSKAYAKRFRRYRTMISFVPTPIYKILSKYFILKQIRSEEISAPETEVEFWVEFFREAFDSGRVGKEMLLSHTDILVDYFENYQFEADDLHGWNGDILIIEAEEDRIVSEYERERLKELYPRAKTILLENSSHFGTGLLQPEEIIQEIVDFLYQPLENN